MQQLRDIIILKGLQNLAGKSNHEEFCLPLRPKSIVFFLIVTLLAIIVRYIGRDVISQDMELAFLPWFVTMKNGGGLNALNKQVGDYSLLYQTIVACLTYIDANPVYLYKIISVLFDFLIAFSVLYFSVNCFVGSSNAKVNKKRNLCLSYACVILLPTMVMNSAYWGQCDSLYTFFLLWSIWFLYKESYPLSFFALGCSLAFKLQAILLLPLFVYAYFSKRNIHLFNIIIAAITFWLSGIVVYICRQNLFANIEIYSNQVTMFKRMWMNVPSFWFFITVDYNKFYLVAIGLTLLILGIGLLLVINGRKKMNTFEQIIELAVFIEWTCIIFLPAMHDRYTYVLDLLLLILAIVVGRKYFSYTLVATITSTITYISYLFTGQVLLNSWIVFLYILTWLYYSYNLFFCSTNKYCYPTSA